MSEKPKTPPNRPGGGPAFFGGGHGMMPPAKSKDFRSSFRRLASYLKPHAALIALILVFGVASVTSSILGPKLLGNATNVVFEGVIGKQLPAGASKAQVVEGLRARGQERFADMLSSMHVVPGKGIDFARMQRILIVVALVYVLSSLFMWLMQYLMAGVAQKIVYRLRSQVDEKLGRLPLKYFDDNPRGDILSRVTNDIDNIAQTLQQSLMQIVTSVLTLAGVLIMMFTISPLLAAVSLLVLPLSVITTMAIVKRSQVQFVAQWQRTGTLNSHVEEMHTGHSIVKVFGRQAEAIERFDEYNEHLYDASFRAQFVSGIIHPAMNFVTNLNYVAICVIGGLRVANGLLTLGDVQAFIQYARQFGQPITQVASIANVLQSTVASAERVFELLDEEDEIPKTSTPTRLDRITGHVVFEDVSFSYRADTPLIENLSLDAKPGSTIAIVGPTGAGKTTLVNLLMRFYEIQDGTISIDGVDIRDMRREDVRSTFGMVLQDTWLFGGTIRENIEYGRHGASEEHVLSAARAANVDHFVRTLPDGYDTVLNDEASNISAGERQLLTIARAFLADPEVLILDEATSSVDTRTEVMIQRAMSELMKGRTAFVIAHRLSTIRHADTIVVMNHGRIVEQGTHEQLISKQGFYYDLYNSQFAEALDEAV